MYNLFARMKSYVPTTRRFLLDFNKSFKFFHPAIIWHFFQYWTEIIPKFGSIRCVIPPLHNIYFQGHFFMIRYIEYWQQNNVIQCVHKFYLIFKINYICTYTSSLHMKLDKKRWLWSCQKLNSYLLQIWPTASGHWSLRWQILF